MKPIDFPEVNVVLNPPRDAVYDDNVKGIEPLRAWGDGWQITSCWRPTLRERLSILLFGRVWLTVLGNAHPPVALTGSRTYFLAPGEDDAP